MICFHGIKRGGLVGSGKYDRRVEVQNYTDTENDYGEPVQTWAFQSSIWAMVNYGSGGERRVGAAQEQANLPVTVTVRYSTFTGAITPENSRLAFDGHIWDIESVAPGKRRNWEIIIIGRAQLS